MSKALPALALSLISTVVVAACMDRPVVATEPYTTNLFVAPVQRDVIDKIDLLFMIDNSRSMGDKQQLLANAVPQLVNRLVVPRCVNKAGQRATRASLDEPCPAGMQPEFRAVRDIHVAVITSSLGSHAATAVAGCGDSPPGNDGGKLLPSVRSGLTSYENRGFLAWDPDHKAMPAGEADATALGMRFGEMVKAAREDGCGYESSLEAWYRFLIDPEPPKTLAVDGTYPNQRTIVTAIDDELLAQRRAFLRPDSLVAIVMLSDENDCSIQDEAFGFMAAEPSTGSHRMWRANSVCARDPNDRCCGPCLANAPAGCPSNDSDAACQLGKFLDPQKDARADPSNLRCLENKRRFGYDFLYPISRYVRGLTEPQVPQRSTGKLVDNPLFRASADAPLRSRDLVYLAGIVGVPWQDIADAPSLTGSGLHYLTAAQLSEQQRWDVIAGAPDRAAPPTDPFMLESTAPRTGTNPFTGEAIAPASSTNPRANSINGHEQLDTDGTDLQYACTFQLSEPAPCSGDDCDCNAPANDQDPGELSRNRPLCQPPGGGVAQPTQYFGKAYPGLRHLQVLRGIGDAAIVASICPKVLNPGAPGYGYEPAVDAIIDRLGTALVGRCLPRPLAVQPGSTGQLPCSVVEASAPKQGDSCGCSATGRHPASSDAKRLVVQELADRHQCGTASTPSCEAFCLCELEQAQGDALKQCLNTVGELSSLPGYCYVNPEGDPPQGNPALLTDCGADRQMIRFVGPDTPAPGSTAFIACLGKALY